jgi:hypothetical protein
MKRRYFGRVGVNKVYTGASSVNVNIDSDQGLDLAMAIISASKTGRPEDIVFYTARIQKSSWQIPRGKIPATVTVGIRRVK